MNGEARIALTTLQPQAPSTSWWLDRETREAFQEAAAKERLRMAGSPIARVVKPMVIGELR